MEPLDLLPQESPESRFCTVELHPRFRAKAQRLKLTPAENRTLALIIMRMPRAASNIEPLPGDGDERVFSMPKNVFLAGSDSAELAPVTVRFILEDTIAYIVSVGPCASTGTIISENGWVEELLQAHRAR